MRKCRFCESTELRGVLDLGFHPPSNAFLTREQMERGYPVSPLRLYVCEECFLVQIDESVPVSDIFTDNYVYYSSESPANVTHAKAYCDMMLERFPNIKHVLEIGSNDGYMLQHFKERGCRVMGIDPATGPAAIANKKGIPTVIAFFNAKNAAMSVGVADLICGINVLNHQSNINDFVEGLKIALAPEGIITFEFPHLSQMIEKCEWDTIYHEHLNYYSLFTIMQIFSENGLFIFDVDEIPEHGGSLRIYARHAEEELLQFPPTLKLQILLQKELDAGVNTAAYYRRFAAKVNESREQIRRFIDYVHEYDMTVMIYGAAAKANTLLNYCGLTSADIYFAADRSPHKIGKYMPGSHVPVVSPDEIASIRPNYVLITARNLKDEIMEQLKFIREWNGKFVVPIPSLEVLL